MCISFEKVSAKRNEGNVGLLRGLCQQSLDAGYNVAIIKLPVEIMEIDTRYQTEIRTERNLSYLINNWDENRLLPLVGVPHWDEGKVYLVDGYGRWIASQLVDKEKYTHLMVMVILNAPTDKTERLEFESEMYAFQNRNVAKVSPIQKHGAMLILHDKATQKLEELKNTYKFEYRSVRGNRGDSVLGSYKLAVDMCKIDDGKLADYMFEIIKRSGFNRKSNGYSTYVMMTIRDIYKLYPNDRMEIMSVLSNKWRNITPLQVKSNAVVKYPMLDYRIAVSLYVEDEIIDALKLDRVREFKDNKVVFKTA